MKINLKQLPAKLNPILQAFKRYAVMIFIVVMLVVFGFFVFRINQFSRITPSEDAIDEKLQTVQRPRIDQAVLDKIQQLQSQNIQVQSLFDNARNNPFSE